MRDGEIQDADGSQQWRQHCGRSSWVIDATISRVRTATEGQTRVIFLIASVTEALHVTFVTKRRQKYEQQ